jgi:hypothetical protein
VGWAWWKLRQQQRLPFSSAALLYAGCENSDAKDESADRLSAPTRDTSVQSRLNGSVEWPIAEALLMMEDKVNKHSLARGFASAG